MKAILKPTFVLVAICALVAALLAGVHLITKDRIAEVEAALIREAAVSVLPKCDAVRPVDAEGMQAFVGVEEDESVVGYAITVVTKGYGGDVVVTTGFDLAGKITGVSVSATEETPGLGANVMKPGFLGQFVGVSHETVLDINVNVDRETGASYSSRAVTEAINLASAQFRVLREGGM